MEQRRGGVTLAELRPKWDELIVECFGFWNKAHAQRMLAGSPNIHGEKTMDSCALRPSALSSARLLAMSRNRREVFSMVA